MNLEDRYLQSLASSFVEPVEPQPAAQQEPTPVAGTVRPGAMQGEMRAIPETQLERSLYTLGVSLEEAGKSLDKYAPGSINDLLEELRIKKKVPVIGDLRLRDIIPFIGGTEKVEDPRTGETVTKEVGTPQALKMAGRGESLTTGTGFTTQMKPDVKAAAMDVGLTVAPVAKKAGQAAVKAGKKVLDATKDLPVGLSIKDVGAVKLADDLTVDVAPAVRTKNFKNWFGDSKVVDDQGKPLVMYHGTPANFEEFGTGPRGAIFVSSDPKFANDYAGGEYSFDIGGTPNIMPLYVKASNPFDYSNPEHVKKIQDLIPKTGEEYFDAPISDLSSGDWAIIELKVVQDAIKKAGFDAFYVKEEGVRNLGVFDPTQIKSAIGNVGTFDPKNPSIIRGAAAAPAVPAAMQDEESK